MLWTAWCALHSLLISRTARRAASRVVKNSPAVYRIVYIIFSLVTLVPVLWYHISIPQRILIDRNWIITAVQLILVIYSLLMFYLGARVYDMQYFLGITQWKNARKSRPTIPLPFHSDGILAHIRHPWYSGGIALIWGVGNITDVYIMTRLILTAYFIIGTHLEEKRLQTELGEPYRAYCLNVPMLFPLKLKKYLN